MKKTLLSFGVFFFLPFFLHTPLRAELVLIPGEEFIGGEQDIEEMSFINDALRVKQAQEILAAKNQGEKGRVFHRKNNGTVLGEFEVLDNLPPEARFGIFAKPAKWLTLVRLSGGVGVKQSDLLPDVMGFAMKLLQYDPSQPLDSQTIQTMDWLMTNSKVGFGDDQREFVEFMEANVKKGIVGQRLGLYFAKHPRVLLRVLQSSLGPHAGSLFATYGSGHPYLLNSDTAMKMSVHLDYNRIFQNLEPTVGPHEVNAIAQAEEYGVGWSPIDYISRVVKAIKDPNYLRNDFYKMVRHGSVSLVFNLEIQDKVHSENTPLEKGLTVWKTHKIPVARLTLHQQTLDSELLTLGNALGFNPGNYLFGHRPAGRTGRGRLFTYTRSQEGRGAADPAEIQANLRRVIAKANELTAHLESLGCRQLL